MKSLTLTISCFIAIIIVTSGLVAQQPGRADGISAIQRGAYSRGIEILKLVTKADDSDAEGWYFLGFAYLQEAKTGDAVKALRRAARLKPDKDNYLSTLAYAYLLTRDGKVDSTTSAALKINPNNVDALYVSGVRDLRAGRFDAALSTAEKIINLNPHHASAYRLKAESLLAEFASNIESTEKDKYPSGYTLVPQASAAFEKFLEVGGKNVPVKLAEMRDIFQFFGKYYTDHAPTAATKPLEAEQGTRAVKLMQKPRPDYPDEARNAGIGGVVLLAVEFSGDGSIGRILTIKSPDPDLADAAIAAARRLKFIPAAIKGVPQTTVHIVEYTFTVG